MGPVAEAFLVGAAAAGVSRLGGELADILALGAAHGQRRRWLPRSDGPWRIGGGGPPTSVPSSPPPARPPPHDRPGSRSPTC